MTSSATSPDIDWDVIKAKLQHSHTVQVDGCWCPKSTARQPIATIHGITRTLKLWNFCFLNKQFALAGKLSTICSQPRCVNPAHQVLTSKMNKGEEWTDSDYLSIQKRLDKLSEDSLDSKYPCCRNWIGSTIKGYGQFSIKARFISSHVASYLVKTRSSQIPDHQVVRHLCGNSLCIKPGHLDIGTQLDNIKDKIKQGKATPKISIELARNIKNSRGDGSQRERAVRFSVSPKLIGSMDAGWTWGWMGHSPVEDDMNKRNKKQKCSNRFDSVWYQQASDYIKQRVDIKNETGCWLWKGKKICGYGNARFKGITYPSHRLSYFAANKINLDRAIKVRHKCRETSCCNPSHLNAGTAKDNAQDRIRDGTSGRGELSASSKITEDMARKIIASKGKGTIQERVLEFNVSFYIIADIDKNASWKHLSRNSGTDAQTEKKGCKRKRDIMEA